MTAVLILIMTILFALSIVFRIPTVHEIPDWVWYLSGYPHYAWDWSVLLFVMVGCVVTWMCTRPFQSSSESFHWMWYGWLATALQFAFAVIEGDGLLGILRNVVQSGHQQFVFIVSEEYSIYSILYEYDTLVQQSGYSYAQTKPPGYLLVYAFLSNVFQWVVPVVRVDGIPPKNSIAYQQIALGIAYTAPILASFWVFPLYKTLRAQFPDDIPKDAMLSQVVLPLLLGITTPSFVLITHHADQFIGLPISACMLYGIWYIVHNIHVRRDVKYSITDLVLPCLLGVFGYLLVYFSFSMIPVLWMAGMYYGMHVFGMNIPKSRIVQTIVSVILGWSGIAVFMWVVFDYHPILRYHSAMLFHQQWKDTVWSWDVCVLNAVEWFWWFGPVGVYMLGMASWNMLQRKNGWKLGVVCWSTMFLLLCFSNTKGEVARLWIFLLPWVCAWIGRSGVFAKEKWGYLLLAQGIWLWSIHYGQDFW